ncbi:hypothetical protein HispidOSU_030415 [Sigmodon hispidus]
MSHSHPAGLLATYNSLTDKHLAGYFNNARIRRHLLRSGLITRSGRILSEKEYKVNTMKRDHEKSIRECLAQAIFHKVLDMERYHQLEIKKKLDTLARKERIQRLKGEHTRRFIEDNMPILTPHPPAGPKTNRGYSVLAEEGRSSPLTLTAPRPYTAPGNMQPPIRLQPLLSNRTTRNVSKITSGSKPKTSLLESEAPFPIGGKKAMMKFRNAMDCSQRSDPYQLPDINSYLIPVPPTLQPQAGKISRENRPEPWRRKRLRPITAPNGLEPLCTRDPGRIYKTAPHSNAVITMIYFGKNVHLSYDNTDYRDEIKIYQQHCGGENLCIYKGKLLEKDTFQFISKRHHGFPFSLTFFLNGIQVNRLSSCCEFKHRRSSRLGGRRGYFGFVSVEKASPCYRCIIAMGLDRKPSLIKPKKEKIAEKKEEPLKRSPGKVRKDRDNTPSRRNEMEGKETSVSATFSAEDIKSGVREVRTAIEEMEWKGKSGQDVWEEDQENTFKYDYEEDFEVDEEKQDERIEDEGQTEDQRRETPKSPTEGAKANLNPKEETEEFSETAADVRDSENCRDYEYSDSEEDEKQDIKTVSSISSRSHPYSSESEDESTELCAEAHSGNSTGGSSRSSSSQDLQDNDDQGKFPFPVEESLETEIEEQEITKVDVDNKPPALIEVSFTHATEEEPTEGTQEKTEPKVSKQSASPEAKGGTVRVQDREADLPGPEEEEQITGEAQSPGHFCSNTTAGLNTTEDGVTPTRKLEVNLGRVVEERAAISSNKQPEKAAQEVCTQEKEAAVKEDDGFQSEDADTNAELREETRMEEDIAHHLQDADMDVGLREKSGIAEVPLGKRSPTEEQPTLAEQSTLKRECPLSTAGEAEADTECSRYSEEQVNPTGKVAEGGSVFLSVDQALDSQRAVNLDSPALIQIVLENQRAVSEREPILDEAELTESTVFNSENLGETLVLKEAETLEMEGADLEAGTPRSDGDQGKEGTLSEPEDLEPMEGTEPDKQDGFEEAIFGGEKAATQGKEVLQAEALLSSSAGEASASPREVVQGNSDELSKEDSAREEVMADTESTLEQDPTVMLPGEFTAAGETKKVEMPPTPPRETGSEREEVTEVKMLKTEEKFEEQNVQGEGGAERKVGDEEETRASPNKAEADAEDINPTGGAKLHENTRLLEDSLKERTITLFAARLQCGKSLEENKAAAMENKGAEELPGQRSEDPAQQGKEPRHDEKGLLGAPGPKPAGKTPMPESDPKARGQEWAAKDLDSLEGPERLDEEGSLQMQRRDIITTQGNLPGTRLAIAEVFNGEAEGEELQEDGCEHRKHSPETETDSLAGQEGPMGGGTVKDEQSPHGRGAEIAADQRGMWVESTLTRHRAGEALGETASEERVTAEDMVPRTEKVAVAQEVTSAGSLEITQEQKEPAMQESEGGEVKASQHAGMAGEGTANGRHAGEQSGAAEEFRGPVTQEETELSSV